MVVLGLDPGTVNFGWSLVDSDFNVLRCGLVQNTIRSVKEAREQQKSFLAEMRGYAKQAGSVVAERYQARSVGGRSAVMGSLPEMVNLMLGGLIVHRDVELVPAMIWKAQVKKVLDLDRLYKVCRAPAHVLDASMLACWRHHKLLNTTFHPTLKQVKKVVDSIESGFDGKLRNVRERERFIREFADDYRSKHNVTKQ